MADGVVAQAQTVELSQHRQASFIQARQVVVRQISGDGEGDKRSCVRSGRRPLAVTSPRKRAVQLDLHV